MNTEGVFASSVLYIKLGNIKMSNASKAIVTCVVIGVLGIISSFVMFNFYYHDKAVAFEETIMTLSKSSESTLSNGTMALLDKASIKNSYATDFKESLRISIDGRYANDQNVAMKWIQENSQPLSTALYTDISSYIEGMRLDFKISQDRIIDQCRAYRIIQRSAFSSMFLSNFPSDEFDQDTLCSIVSDAKTKKAFSTGEQTSIL